MAAPGATPQKRFASVIGGQALLNQAEAVATLRKQMELTPGLLDTVLTVIPAQVYFDLPFVVLLMRGFFADIPMDLEEAARVDGDTSFGAFRHVGLPLAVPGCPSPYLC